MLLRLSFVMLVVAAGCQGSQSPPPVDAHPIDTRPADARIVDAAADAPRDAASDAPHDASGHD